MFKVQKLKYHKVGTCVRLKFTNLRLFLVVQPSLVSDFASHNLICNFQNKFVISTRVRCGRSLQGYPFNPCLTEAQYKEMEDKVSSTLNGLDGELKGTFYPLTGMAKEVQQQLIDDHFLFKEGDRFLQVQFSFRFNIF